MQPKRSILKGQQRSLGSNGQRITEGDSDVWTQRRNFKKNDMVRTCYGKLKGDEISEMSLGLVM